MYHFYQPPPKKVAARQVESARKASLSARPAPHHDIPSPSPGPADPRSPPSPPDISRPSWVSPPPSAAAVDGVKEVWRPTAPRSKGSSPAPVPVQAPPSPPSEEEWRNDSVTQVPVQQPRRQSSRRASASNASPLTQQRRNAAYRMSALPSYRAPILREDIFNEKADEPGTPMATAPAPPPPPPPAPVQQVPAPVPAPAQSVGAGVVQPPVCEVVEVELAHTNPLQAHPVNPRDVPGRPRKASIQVTHQQIDSEPTPRAPTHPTSHTATDPRPELSVDTTVSADSGRSPPPSGSPTSKQNSPSKSGSPFKHGSPSKDPRAPNAKWLHNLGQKTSTGINSLASKIGGGGHGFHPEAMEKECERAAMVLHTFCKYGVYAEPPPLADDEDPSSAGASDQPTPITPGDGPKTLVTIPTKVIDKAVGLVVFTTSKPGIHLQGATGSGVVVSRLQDGGWSPPSAVNLQSFEGGLISATDVYDGVCVINTQEALSAFMGTKLSVGNDVPVKAGPWSVGGHLGWGSLAEKPSEELIRRTSTLDAAAAEQAALAATNRFRKGSEAGNAFAPVLSYLQYRGCFVGTQYEGSVVQERKRVNASFYGNSATGERVLRGLEPAPDSMPGLQKFSNVLRMADGKALLRSDSDLSLAGSEVKLGSDDGSITPTMPNEPSI